MCFGGDSNVPTVPLDPNLGKVQGATYDATAGLSAYTPQTQSIFYNQQSNPYAAPAIQGAGVAGQAGQQLGGQTLNNSQQFAGVPTQLAPYIQQTLNTAYDPQSALYNQYRQQNQDTTNADLASRGLAYSPYGAGVAATSNQQFDTNWLQTLLNREQTGMNTAATGIQAGEGAANTASTLGQAGVTDIAQGAALPYTVSTGINQDLASTVPFLTSNQQQQIGDYLGYYGQANANTANSIAAGKAQDQADQALGQGIGTLMGNLFSGTGTKALSKILAF